ncbi:MAG: hypothetical protein GY749_24165, partial [Desulfobacteraceae bacterium]|nr:hypothetical protein [Desulfobacteraceae bacterium]
MSLPELEKEYIQPLTRTEKWQLIKDIQKMLQQEERAEEEELRKIFKPGTVYEIATPSLAYDGDDAETAAQLQKILDE